MLITDRGSDGEPFDVAGLRLRRQRRKPTELVAAAFPDPMRAILTLLAFPSIHHFSDGVPCLSCPVTCPTSPALVAVTLSSGVELNPGPKCSVADGLVEGSGSPGSRMVVMV